MPRITYIDDLLEEQCVANHNLVTNFSKEQEPIYRQAISEYGWDGLYITEDAFWRDGRKDDKLFALRCTEKRDLSKFWKIFNNLKESNK